MVRDRISNNRAGAVETHLLFHVANHVLEEAMRPGVNGVPPELFQRCVGVLLVSVVEFGFVFSGNVGTGILLAKQGDGRWSKPSAVGLTGVGWGLLVGGSIKELMVFIMSEATLDGVTSDSGIKLGGQAEITLGPFGRTAKLDIHAGNRGVGGTISIAFSKGVFLGLSVEGAIVGTRNAVNYSFYGRDVSTRQVLFDPSLDFPTDKTTLMDDVYAKLATLSKGRAEAEGEADTPTVQPDGVDVDAAAGASHS